MNFTDPISPLLGDTIALNTTALGALNTSGTANLWVTVAVLLVTLVQLGLHIKTTSTCCGSSQCSTAADVGDGAGDTVHAKP